MGTWLDGVTEIQRKDHRQIACRKDRIADSCSSPSQNEEQKRYRHQSKEILDPKMGEQIKQPPEPAAESKNSRGGEDGAGRADQATQVDSWAGWIRFIPLGFEHVDYAEALAAASA